MKNKLFSSVLKKVKHYKQIITKIVSAYKKKHAVPVSNTSICSLLEIPGRYLLKRKAVSYSGSNTTQYHQIGEETKRTGVLQDIFFFIIIGVSTSALISFLPLPCSPISFLSSHSKHCCHCTAARDSILYPPPASQTIQLHGACYQTSKVKFLL